MPCGRSSPNGAPRVVHTAAEAHACVKQDGICILQLATEAEALVAPPGEWRHRAGALAAEIFGDALTMAKVPVGVDDPSRVLKPHNDGGNPYGDLFPDFLFMVCERAADTGGESYMIDGHDILRSFPTEQQQLYFDTPVESKSFEKMQGKQAVWRSPMVQKVGGSGRWCLRVEGGGGFNRDQPCEGEGEAVQQVGSNLLTQWDTARDEAGAAAPRFRLLPVCVQGTDLIWWILVDSERLLVSHRGRR